MDEVNLEGWFPHPRRFPWAATSNPVIQLILSCYRVAGSVLRQRINSEQTDKSPVFPLIQHGLQKGPSSLLSHSYGPWGHFELLFTILAVLSRYGIQNDTGGRCESGVGRMVQPWWPSTETEQRQPGTWTGRPSATKLGSSAWHAASQMLRCRSLQQLLLFSSQVMSESLRPHCSTPSFHVLHYLLEFAQTGPLSWWCHPTISSPVIPFSSCPQSFPASGSFPVSQSFASGGQSIGVSSSASVPSKEYSVLISFRIDWFDLLAVQRTLKSLLQHHNSKASAFFMVQPSHLYMTTGKTIALMDLCQQSNVSAFKCAACHSFSSRSKVF